MPRREIVQRVAAGIAAIGIGTLFGCSKRLGSRGITLKNSRFKGSDMLFWESDERDDGYFNDGASNPAEGLTERHVYGAMFGYFDGHADYIKWKKWTQLLAEPNKNSLWCYPKSSNGR